MALWKYSLSRIHTFLFGNVILESHNDIHNGIKVSSKTEQQEAKTLVSNNLLRGSPDEVRRP